MAQEFHSGSQSAHAETRLSWLPFVRVSSTPRPVASLGEDALTMFLGGFSLFALFMDGWRHNNMIGIDEFWSWAHILMYSGILALAVWITVVLVRHQESLRHLDWTAVPAGYRLAFLALPLAMVAGPADFRWHAAFGFENQIDSTYSPPHQGLFLAGALLAAIPAASAWQRRGSAPSFGSFLPAALSISSVASMLMFVIHQLVPFYSAGAMSEAFQQDIAGRLDAFAHGPGAVHTEGLSTAIHLFGDEAWPYYFYATHHTMAGILLFSAILLGAVLVMRRRWRPPFGSVTVICAWLAFLFPLLSQLREWPLALSLVGAGVLGDMFMGGLLGAPGPVRLGRVRIFAMLLPMLLWSLYLVCVELFKGGLGWGPTLYVGVLTTTAGFGYALSLLVFPPSAGAPAEEAPELMESVVAAPV